MENTMDNIELTNIMRNEECPICFEVIYSMQNMMIGKCGHILCFDCFVKCSIYGRGCPMCKFTQKYCQTVKNIDPAYIYDFENGIITDCTKAFYLGYIRGWEHQEQHEIKMEDSCILQIKDINDSVNLSSSLLVISQERYNEMAKEINCPICYEEMGVDNYSVTPCGHLVCSECMCKCIHQNMNCPICRFEFENKKKAYRNYILPPLPINIIEDFENDRITEFTAAFYNGHNLAIHDINAEFAELEKEKIQQQLEEEEDDERRNRM